MVLDDVVKRIDLLLALALSVGLISGCGGPATPDPRMVELAVRATVHALPTPEPALVEVTRVVEVTRLIQVTRVVEVTPTPVTPAPTPTNTVTPEAQARREPVATPREVVVQAAAPGPVAPSCPITSSRRYAAVPVVGAPAEHPDSLHGDLNLALRGFERISAHSGLITINGPTDGDPPQLIGLFADGRVPNFANNYRVRGWNWSCAIHGCPTGPLDHVEVSMVGVGTVPDEQVRIPSRSAQIYGGGFKALVLYADDNRITLGYTREDTVATGYAVHIESLCVDPNLLALYRTVNVAGRGQLPALRNGEAVGTAAGSELGVAVRDAGTFLDPRSRKDWWKGY